MASHSALFRLFQLLRVTFQISSTVSVNCIKWESGTASRILYQNVKCYIQYCIAFGKVSRVPFQVLSMGQKMLYLQLLKLSRIVQLRASWPPYPTSPLSLLAVQPIHSTGWARCSKYQIEWGAKGGIMTKPTIFGMNGNNLMVGGEAGNEAVLPLNDKTLGAGSRRRSTMGEPPTINITITGNTVRS